jgi:hypothetical protein
MLRPDGRLMVYEYTGEGLNPSLIRPEKKEDWDRRISRNQVVNTHPDLKEWASAHRPRSTSTRGSRRAHVHATDRMKLAAAYPIVEGYKQKPTVGYYFHLEDPMQFHQLSAALSVSAMGGFGDGRGTSRGHRI